MYGSPTGSARGCLHLKAEGVESASDYLTKTMSQQKGGTINGGSVTLLRPDGTPYPGSPFKSGALPGPWAVAVDGNDNIWISNFAGPSVVWSAHGALPARRSHGRADFASQRLRGRRPADADRYCYRSGRECLGDEQLARYR